MKYLTFICLLALSSCVKIDLQDAKASRRLSYSTNVVHDDPKYPNHAHASSSINFKFNTNSAESQESHANTYRPLSSRKALVYTTPKSTYEDQYPNSQEEYNLKYSPSTQSYLNNNRPYPQTQSFNVGYSMRFNNKDALASHQVPSFANTGEIITGSRKEEVIKPASGSSQNSGTSFIGDDFVRNSLIDSKKQKISGIKAKYPQANKLNVNTKQLLAQANLSPKTQKQLAYLETAKNMGLKFGLDTTKDQISNNSPWQSLSPTVEIYQSKELTPSLYNQEAISFDHSRALGKSEGFDVSNVVNMELANVQTSPRSSTYFKPELNYRTDKSSSQYVSYKKPLSVPKLPIDTSLLRDPFLTTENLSPMPGSKTIPIHFDTSLIQVMNKHIVDSNTHHPAFVDSSLETGASSNTGELSYKLPTYPNLNSAYSSPSSSPYYQTPSPLTSKKNKPMKYGFKPPTENPSLANPSTAQQFGFEAPKQVFIGPNNNPHLHSRGQQLYDSINAQLEGQKYPGQQVQVQVKQPSYSSYFNKNNGGASQGFATFGNDFGSASLKGTAYDAFRDASTDFYNVHPQKSLKDAAFLMANEQQNQPIVSNAESTQYFNKEFNNYMQKIKGVQHDFSGVPDMPDAAKEPEKFKEFIKSKDYDFQGEFDKILYSSSIKPAENHQTGQQTGQSEVQYKGPSYKTEQFGSNLNTKFNRYHSKNNPPKQLSNSSQQSHKKRENHPQQNHKNQHAPRQSRLNIKTRVVREYIDTDLKPPPLQVNKDRYSNSHNRRAQYHI